MKPSTLVLGGLLVCGGILALAHVLCSQERSQAQRSDERAEPASTEKEKPMAKEEPPADAQAESLEPMKKWLEFAAPGAHHIKLDPLVGKWNYRQTLWMGPDSPPTENSGTTEVRWIMGQRFVQIQSTGKFLDKDFHSMWLLGFDNLKKKYVSCYIDNLGSGLYPAEGGAGPGDRGIILVSRMDDWFTGEHDRGFTYAIRSLDEDKWTFEMTDLTSGAKAMEVVYTRKKEGSTEK
jgi:hypothetical protein